MFKITNFNKKQKLIFSKKNTLIASILFWVN